MPSGVWTFASLVLVISVMGLKTQANETLSKCDVKNYIDIIQCIEKNSYKMKSSELRLKSASSAKMAADQWINPELDVERVVKDSTASETSASLLFTMRLSGKKAALVNEAESSFQKEKIQIGMDHQLARLQSMLDLYRLAQLKRELEIEDETIKTFSKVIKQYNRPKLSPEQDVSLSIFKMALADHEIKIISLQSEEEMIYSKLILLSGLTKAEIEKNLPQSKKDWPDYKASSNLENSLDIKIAEADLRLAESQLDKAKSDAWPELKIGPAIKQVQVGDVKEDFIGATLSMPLPVFNLNGNLKAAEANRVEAAKLEYNNSKQQALNLNKNMVRKYNSLVQTLKKSISNKIVDQNHQKIEKQFFNGLVSSALVIEAHRQFIDFEVSRNQAELEAIESLGKLYILDEKFEGIIL